MPINKQRQTRLNRTQQREAKKALFKYLAFTFFLIAAFALFIIPFLIPKITSLLENTLSKKALTMSDDVTPPPPPKINDLPRFSNQRNIEIKGFTEPGATVYFVVNKRDQKVVADKSGHFSIDTELVEGENEIYAFAQDSAGNKSTSSQTSIVIGDYEPPEINIISPQDGAIVFGKDRSVRIEGETNENAKITINERVAIINKSGRFNLSVILEEGSNNFEIIALDAAGNETKKNLTLSYTP